MTHKQQAESTRKRCINLNKNLIILQDCLKLKKHCQAGNIINAKEKNIYIYVYAKFQYTNFHNYYTPNREPK